MLDATDSRLLAEIQADAMVTAQDLGERLNLSPSQAARRRQRHAGLTQGEATQQPFEPLIRITRIHHHAPLSHQLHQRCQHLTAQS